MKIRFPFEPNHLRPPTRPLFSRKPPFKADGSYALVAPCKSVDYPGAPYAVAVGNEAATIKLVRPLANSIKLEPCSDDPTHRPMVFDFSREDDEEVAIIGRVVWYCPQVDWTPSPVG